MKRSLESISWIIGRKVSGVSTSDLNCDEASSVTIFFDDGSSISFGSQYAESSGWTKVDVSSKQPTSEEDANHSGLERLTIC